MEKKKGFTLIELLVVIIILALIMGISVPAVARYIESARKSTFLESINKYVETVSTDMTAGGAIDTGWSFPQGTEIDDTTLYFVPVSKINIQKGGKDPFGDFKSDSSGVIVVYDNKDGYKYGFQFDDVSGHFMNPTPEKELDVKKIMTKRKASDKTLQELGKLNGKTDLDIRFGGKKYTKVVVAN